MDESQAANSEWLDRDRAWWVKLRRARLHAKDAQHLADEYQRARPFRTESRPGREKNEIGFFLYLDALPPAELSAIAGDAIHNLRSALDAVAFYLATRGGRSLTPKQERSIYFPIAESAEELDLWFGQRNVRGLFDDDAKRGFRCVQSFALSEEFPEVAGAVDTQAEYRHSVVRRINNLWNIDKHRRLPLVSWFPDLTYWTSSGDDQQFRWQPQPWADPALGEGVCLGYLSNPGSDAPPAAEVFHEFRLRLVDDEVPPCDLGDTLENWHREIGNWVIPRTLVVADGHKAPFMLPNIPQAFD